MVYVLIVIGLLGCAIQAVRAQRLLISALWLAGASALTALLIYLLGAPEVAVIELSVGAGLVTVLFVFAINIAGEERLDLIPVMPRPLAWLLVACTGALLVWMNLGVFGRVIDIVNSIGFSNFIWEDRKLDVFLQVALIFAGVLGVLGLMSDTHPQAAIHPGSPEIKEAQHDR